MPRRGVSPGVSAGPNGGVVTGSVDSVMGVSDGVSSSAASILVSVDDGVVSSAKAVVLNVSTEAVAAASNPNFASIGSTLSGK